MMARIYSCRIFLLNRSVGRRNEAAPVRDCGAHVRGPLGVPPAVRGRCSCFATPKRDYAAPVGPTRADVSNKAGGSDAAVPVASRGFGARVGGSAGGCGPSDGVGGASTGAVSGDRLRRQQWQRLGVDDYVKTSITGRPWMG